MADEEDEIKLHVQVICREISNPRNYFEDRKLRRHARFQVKRSCLWLYRLLESRAADRIEREITYNNVLRSIYERYKKSYIAAAQLVDEWRPNRRNYIEKLNQLIEGLDKQFKMFSYLKLITSSVEVSGTIIGELLLGSEFGWDKKALKLAYSFGFCSTICSALELGRTKQILLWASEFLRNDRSHLEPFVQWFRDQKLDYVIRNLFHHGIDMDIARQIQETQEQESRSFNIFMSVLISNLREDPNLSQDADFLLTVYLFANSNLAWMWWCKISQRRCAFIENFNSSVTLIGDSVSQMKSMLSQGIPAFLVEQQRITRIPVENRIMLNLISMFHSCMDLKHGSKSEISARLRRVRNNMVAEWSDVETTVTMMRDCLFTN